MKRFAWKYSRDSQKTNAANEIPAKETERERKSRENLITSQLSSRLLITGEIKNSLSLQPLINQTIDISQSSECALKCLAVSSNGLNADKRFDE